MSKPVNCTLKEIQAARVELSGYLKPSPLIHSPGLSDRLGCQVFLKMETSQPIGAFKVRGAAYRISRLTEEQKARGVIAASAGNHGQGVAWGARRLGTKATIVMPQSAPIVKISNTKALGAEVVLHGKNYDEAYAHALSLAGEGGRTFIHAYQDDDVIAGQGTIGLEILEQLPDVEVIIGSVGGGGLMAGVAAAVRGSGSGVQLVGCQSSGAAAMVRSFESSRPVVLQEVNTFADGTAVKAASPEMYEFLKSRLDQMIEVDDEAIAAAILALMERAKAVSEGAGAIPLAALTERKQDFQGRKVVLIVSGGNIDVNLLARILDVGLTRTGRRLRVNVLLADRPGTLLKLTQVLALEGANVLQAIHDRDEPSATIDRVEVALTLETRGPEHSDQVVQALRREFSRVELGH